MAEVLDRYAGTSQDIVPADGVASRPAPRRPLAAPRPHRAADRRHRRCTAAPGHRPHRERRGATSSSNDAPDGDGPLHRLRHTVRPVDLPPHGRPRPRPGLALLGGGGGRHLGGDASSPSGSGPTGHVLATDIDVTWAGRRPPAHQCRGAASTTWRPTRRPKGQFDLVHARLVLVHVPEREAALDAMVAALRPGGWLFVEDADPALQPLSCPGGARARPGAGQPAAARLPGPDGRARRGPGLRPHPAPPAPGGRPGPRWGPMPRSRWPSRRAPAGDGDHHLIRDQLLEHGIATEEEIELPPGQRGGRTARSDPAADDRRLGAPPALSLTGAGGRPCDALSHHPGEIGG